MNIAFTVYFNFPHLLQVPPKATGVFVSKAVKDGNPSLRVTWTALQNVANISRYHVDYRRNGELNWGTRVSTQPYSTSTLLPALLPGTEYNVRMRAVSAAGEGEWSEVLTETTFSSKFSHLHFQLCHHSVTFCNSSVSCLSACQNCASSLPSLNASNVVFSVSLPVCY